VPNRPVSPEGPAVPLWVGLTTYLICWGLGGYLLVAESQADSSRTGLLVVGLLLVLFPVLSFQGLGKALVSAIGKRVGGS
jgi:hypothetical protein